MATEKAPIAVFNRGIVDPRALGRVDIKRVALAAEIQTNFMPRVLGSMIMRPGLEFVGNTYNNAEAIYIDFNRSLDDTAIIEVTDSVMRVRVDEAIITRNSVSSAVANGTFDTDLTSWTDSDEAGTVSQWVAGGYLGLTGTKFNSAERRQTVVVSQADRGVQHGIRLVVSRGTCELHVGSTAGGFEYFHADCKEGEFSFAVTPESDLYISIHSSSEYEVLVDSIAIEASGDMLLTTPWNINDLENVRWDQSNDVIFVSSDGYQVRRIERWGTNSWAITKFYTDDGPYRSINVSGTTMTAGALTGTTTLTASSSYFSETHVGAIFRLESLGQKTSDDFTAEDQFGSSIRITGTGTTRKFDIDITGTWTATITLQRSIDDESTWVDVLTYTSNQDTTHTDGLDNEIVFYRLGIKTGDFTSGTATNVLEWHGGSIKGNCRVISYTSSTVVGIIVLDRMGQTTAAINWSEGIWSEFRGWPQALGFYEGRLWLAGKANITGSVSDAFQSFSDQITGDSAAIVRTFANGAINFINWLLGMPNRLMAGTSGEEMSIRSKSIDEVITPTTFNVHPASTEGSERIQAQLIDGQGVYVDSSGFGASNLVFDLQANEYLPGDLSILNPDIGDPGIVKMNVQRKPDTRVHFVRSDGTAAVLLFNPAEEIKVWVEVETGDADGVNGVIEDVIVFPGSQEDVVYYSVKRQINGADVRFLEKWGLESECIGETYNTQADCFIMFINNPASATVTGLDHLEGEIVVCWADGICMKDADGEIQTFTVLNGSISLTDEGSAYSASQGIVGLPYRARFKSGVLPYAASNTALAQKQRISNFALMAVNIHNQGLKFGRDFTNMDNIPKVNKGSVVDPDLIYSFLTLPAVSFPGNTSEESRLFLEANAPRPATVVAAVLGIGTDEKAP